MCVLFCAETAVFKMDTKHFLQKILPKEGFKHVMFTNGQHPKPLWFSYFDEMAAAEMAHSFQNETVELALAHTIKNQAEAAYRRGDQLDRRRELMKHWMLFIEGS